MSLEQDPMSWERDKYFFSHDPSVLPYNLLESNFILDLFSRETTDESEWTFRMKDANA